MTDAVRTDVGIDGAGIVHTTPEAKRRLAKRYAAERRFKYLGLGAVLVAVAFLVFLVGDIVIKAVPAFTYHTLTLELDLSGEAADADPAGLNYDRLVRQSVDRLLPFVEGRRDKRVARGLLSSGAPVIAREELLSDTGRAGGTVRVAVPLDDEVDLFLKGLTADPGTIPAKGVAEPSGTEGTIEITTSGGAFGAALSELKRGLAAQVETFQARVAGLDRSLESRRSFLDLLEKKRDDSAGEAQARLEAQIAKAAAGIAEIEQRRADLVASIEGLNQRIASTEGREPTTLETPSFLVYLNGGIVKLTRIGADGAEGVAVKPLNSDRPAPPGSWRLVRIGTPEATRKISDKEIIYVGALEEEGAVRRRFNGLFFTSGASREAEMAGVWGAVVGSFLTLIVTLAVSFPLGVASAIYLEEFAPKNRWTDLIEVNINNLAAVPSIVFGLLGLAVFLNWANLPRSAPLVGGLVLALMTLPTIIIASRAALKSVPPSIREAALGVGASHLQTVFHHVLPLALPGMLTGTIIGMAQALGETAPLLMIGMVAFIVDIPGGMTDAATVLPVQIFMWADFPEASFQHKTAAAILVLLGFLVFMNVFAVLLRRRFERRW